MEDPTRQPPRNKRPANRNYPPQNAAFNPRQPDSRNPNRRPVQSNPNVHPRQKSKGRSFLIFVLIMAAIFCVTLGLTWIYSNRPSSSDTSGNHLSGRDRQNATLAISEDLVPYTQMLAFSSDKSLPLYGKFIILDPGHGGTDSGCAYPTIDPTLIECELNLKIAFETRDALEAQGATVILLRSDDSWVSLYHRIALTHLYCIQYADQLKEDTLSDSEKTGLIGELSDTIQVNSDAVESGGMGIMSGTGVGEELARLMDLESNLPNVLFISIHVNSNPDSDYHGTQVYYVTDDSVIASEQNLLIEDPSYVNNADFPIRENYYGRDGALNAAFAQSLYDSIISSAPQMETNATSTVADNYAVLREHNLTSVLIEVGFISNEKDRSTLTDSDSVSAIANGIADGCVNFYADES